MLWAAPPTAFISALNYSELSMNFSFPDVDFQRVSLPTPGATAAPPRAVPNSYAQITEAELRGQNARVQKTYRRGDHDVEAVSTIFGYRFLEPEN
jgi:hypothetical protein